MSGTTVVADSVLSYFGFEIGVFTIVTIFSSFFVLRQIKGNFKNLEHFFASKKWPFLNSDSGFIRSTRILTIIAICLLIMPIISLIIWGIMVLVVLNRYDMSNIAGVSIFLVGFSVIFFAMAVLYVKWSYFKIKIISIIFAIVAAILYFAFQLYALLDVSTPSFLGLSAVFLSINAIIMVLITSMVYSNNTGSILDIFDRLPPTTNKEDAVDSKYNKFTVEEQFEKLLNDPEYEVTEKEILRYVTIISSRKDFSSSVLSGGLHTIFRKRSLVFKRIFLLSLYLISVGVLVAYAIIVDKYLPEASLGWVTLVAVVTTDVITFFASQLNISHGPSTLTLLIVGMRCFLFGFGGTYWFLGYCSLYLLLGIVIGWKTVDRYFPLEIDYSKEKNTASWYKRIIKEPLFTYAVVNVVFIIVVAVVAAVTSLDIPRGVFSVFGKDYALWVFGIASILISFTCLAIMTTFRLHQRRLKDIKDKFKFPLIKREFSTYLVFACFTYLFAALCGILWYVIVEDIFVLLTALIVPPVIIAIYMFYLNFKKNDYRFLADIKDQNIKTKAYLEGQAKTKQLKSMLTSKVTGKEDLEAVELKEEVSRNDGVPEFLNFSKSAGKKKFVINEDWRDSMNFFQAFIKRKLLYSDYVNILSTLFILAALITYSVIINATADHYPLRGFTVGVTLFVLTTILLPMEGYFGTLHTPNFIQIILLILGIGGNYGYGIAVTLVQHDEVKDETAAIVTVLYWFFFLPTLLMTGIALYSLKQNKWKKSLLSTILIILSFVHWIVLGVFFVLVDILAAGIVTWGILLLLAGGLYVQHIYKKNNNSFPRKVVHIAGYGGILVLSAVFIVSLCMKSFNDFVGFSITYLAILFCLILYVVRKLIADFANKATSPVFYSPWVFPIYKYDPNLNALKKDSAQGYMTFAVIFFFWIWTIAVSIWITPVSVGISLGCLCEVVAAVYFMYMTSDSTTMLSEALKRDDLFGKTVKKAWLQARGIYMTSKHVTKAADILTFAEYEKETSTLKAFIEETKTGVKNEIEKQQVQQVKPDPESLKKKPESTELKQLYAKLAEKVKATNDAFKDEVRLLIHFELMVLLGIGQAVTKEKMTILAFINTKKSDLEGRGLIFAFGPENLSVDAKYKLVMDKYNLLSVEQQKTFDSLKNAYLDQVKQEKIDASEKMKAEEEAKKQREKAVAQKVEQNKKLIAQDISSVPLKDMPDCLQKYERIVKEYGAAKKKYEDPAFPAGPNALGENLSSLVDKWDRPNGLTLFGQGITNADPRQGAIGDCYFVSSLSVAGKQNIEKALLSDQIQQRPDVGAYIVRFFFMGEPVEVIVDDLFPKDGQGEWAFCKSDNSDKLWPMIFEKAYAKLHGNYQKIVAGKVSYALSELTGGYPEEIKLSTAQKNIDSFWQKIIKYKENGYLLGAGTPENPQGDAAISSEGIIQGHAYAVLDLKDYEDEKLIKLRNPHGQGGAEWNGDWGDNSIKWTDKAKKILKPENKEDGIFWMSLQDFVYEFKCLYICRIFDQKLWKSVPSIEGEWKGDSAAGLPNKKNPSADLSKNPHYGIKVSKRCSVFIALTQEDRIDMFRGKSPIMFMVQKNGGKRITSASTDLLAGTSGAPTDLITVSAEVPLDVPTYPYTFSLMIANANSGPEGEGKFKVDIKCTDDFSVVELK